MKKPNRKERRAAEAQKRKEPERVKLANEERLELFNVHLKKQLIETQVRQQMAIIDKEEREAFAKVKKRHGIDLQDYKLNLETGECTRKTDEERRQGGPRNAPVEPSPPEIEADEVVEEPTEELGDEQEEDVAVEDADEKEEQAA